MYKALTDLKQLIAEREAELVGFANEDVYMGMHRSPGHYADIYEWALGARFRSVLGDLNNWEHRKHFARVGYFGRDDLNYFIILHILNLW